MERAGELLAAGTPRRLDVEVSAHAATAVTLELTTEAVGSVDVYVNGRPAATSAVTDGTTTLAVPIRETGEITVRIEGFDREALVAARTLTLEAA